MPATAGEAIDVPPSSYHAYRVPSAAVVSVRTL